MYQGRRGTGRTRFLLAAAVAVAAGQAAIVQAQQDPNDPWPQYGHDERNTCNSPYRGPHAMPELLWWDELPGITGAGSACSARRGVSIARFDGATYVFGVGTVVDGGVPHARLCQYLARPPLTHTPGSEWNPVWTSNMMKTAGENGDCDTGDPLLSWSTPVVLRNPSDGHVIVVVQTTEDIRAYDRTAGGNSPIWCTTNRVSDVNATYTSPCYGRESETGASFIYAFAHLGGAATNWGLRKINPSDGSVVWTFAGWPTGVRFAATPAIGPIDFSPPLGIQTDSNVVYAASADGAGAGLNFHGVYAADMVDGGGQRSGVLAGSGVVNPWGPDYGTYASPSVHANGDVVVAADDGSVYAFSSQPAAGVYEHRWDELWVAIYCSATAGVAEIDGQRYVFLNSENYNQAAPPLGSFPKAFVVSDSDTSRSLLAEAPFRTTQEPSQLVGGAPVVDSLGRAYYVTGDVLGSNEGGRIAAFGRPTSAPYGLTWAFEPPAALRADASGPLSMDEYGIIYVINWDYILAIRPPFGDFDGDGVVGPIDKNDDACAYLLWRTDPVAWENQFGSVYGINLLGIGDADGDGAVTNNDVNFLLSAWGGGPDGPCP